MRDWENDVTDGLELAWEEETEDEFLRRTRKVEWPWRRSRVTAAPGLTPSAEPAPSPNFQAARLRVDTVAASKPGRPPPSSAPTLGGVITTTPSTPGHAPMLGRMIDEAGAYTRAGLAAFAAATSRIWQRMTGAPDVDSAQQTRSTPADGGSPSTGPPGTRPDGEKPAATRTRIALISSLTLVLVLALGAWAGVAKLKSLFAAEDYDSTKGSGEVTVRIRSGQTASDIAITLRDAGVVKSAPSFIGAANANPDSREIEAGYYKLPKKISAKSALDRLLARDKQGALAYRVVNRITIPEGTISLDVFARLSDFTKIPVADFKKAAANPRALGVPDWWLKRGDDKAMPNPPSIEGFLFPDTYELPPNASAEDILKLMVGHFLTVTGELRFAENVQNNLHITPYEALVAASIAQVETGYDADMGGVARVLYNRAYTDKFPCQCLGLDSEVNYWLRITGQKRQPSGALRDAQLHDPADPYNTHDRPGLPVGPISNPGRAALQGAMDPPKSNNLYFLGIDTAGHTAFAESYEDFCTLVNTAAANGVSIGTC